MLHNLNTQFGTVRYLRHRNNTQFFKPALRRDGLPRIASIARVNSRYNFIGRIFGPQKRDKHPIKEILKTFTISIKFIKHAPLAILILQNNSSRMNAGLVHADDNVMERQRLYLGVRHMLAHTKIRIDRLTINDGHIQHAVQIIDDIRPPLPEPVETRKRRA